MPFYREEDLLAYLEAIGCEYEGDRFPWGMGWFAPDGNPFTIPDPTDGWFDADVIDTILADRWIPAAAPKPKRHER